MINKLVWLYNFITNSSMFVLFYDIVVNSSSALSATLIFLMLTSLLVTKHQAFNAAGS